MKFEPATSRRRLFRGLLAFTMLARLASLGSYPLADTTEARYGEVARLMAETGDWITPRIDYEIPFWAKPPLSFWLSAASIEIYGINELAVRLPSFLTALGVLALVHVLGAGRRGRDSALVATVVLATSALFFISSGAVMTDPALLLGTTLSMVAFWRAVEKDGEGGSGWGVLFFVGLATGLLAKGPVALVLTGIPAGGWVLWRKQWKKAWRRIPWLRGSVLCLMLSVPWYWLAETKTPGFLDYFLVGEHWNRFMIAGWEGDLYGEAHDHLRGTIWLYWLAAASPWSAAWLLALGRRECRRRIGRIFEEDADWIAYLVLWATAPMVFFTLAGNILWTYVLPGLPAFALLTAEVVLGERAPPAQSSSSRERQVRTALRVATATSALFALGMVLTTGYEVLEGKCQKGLVTAYRADLGGAAGGLIYLVKRPHSAGFYGRGTARLAERAEDAEPYLRNATVDYFAVREADVERLPQAVASRFENLGTFDGYCLLKENGLSGKLSSIEP